jgi:hypothetical protein
MPGATIIRKDVTGLLFFIAETRVPETINKAPANIFQKLKFQKKN